MKRKYLTRDGQAEALGVRPQRVSQLAWSDETYPPEVTCPCCGSTGLRSASALARWQRMRERTGRIAT